MSDDAVPPTTAGLLDVIASGAASPGAVAKTALRYEYAGWEVPLAHVASAGRLDPAGLTALAAERAPADAAIDGLDAAGLYALAYLMLGRPDDRDLAQVADLFALARRVAARTGRPTEHVQLDLQVHLACERPVYVREHLPGSGLDAWLTWALETDLVHAFGGGAPAEIQAWHDAFNAPFVARGIAPMRFVDDAAPFDSVRTDAPAASVDGPLISIVMPVYSPSASLVTAVRSLLEQTWRNVQVIVVDDASPEAFDPVFAAVRELDPRVEYVRMPVNGGAYRARNHGLTLARGELVGIQDGDDWSHPQRLERQMQAFDADPRLVATQSKAVRVHTDLRITKIGSLPFTRNAPSLLFRREPVLARMGSFDEMRKAADTEFIERLGAVFGPRAVRTLDEPLSLYQLTDGSLSRGDFRLSWHREARVSYHGSFRQWHQHIRDEGADAYAETPAGRAFPAPPELLGTPYPPAPDVVVLADWRDAPLSHLGLPDEVAALHAAGLTVGLARSDAMRLATDKRHYAGDRVQELLLRGAATWTPHGAPVEPGLLLVRDVDLLTTPRSAAAVALRPRSVVVAADRLPDPVGARRLTYDPVQVEAVVREMFDADTEWLPATASIAAALRAAGASGAIHDATLLGVTDVPRFPARPIVGPVVVGVCDASPFAIERVDRTGLRELLPAGAAYDVRILERSRGRDNRSEWLSMRPDDITLPEFFDQCDIVIGLPPLIAGGGGLTPLLLAMSRGCVPVVHDTWSDLLGDAAVTYGEGSLAALVDRWSTDPATHRAQQERSLALCQTGLSAETFASRLRTLIGTGGIA